MSPTTRRIREMSFALVESQIPAELTIADYREARPAAPARRGRTRRYKFGRRRVSLSST